MKKTPDLILTADWHIRNDIPICRIDDYQEALFRKIKFILKVSEKCNCPILIAGDIGHRPIWGDNLLNKTIDLFRSISIKNKIIVIPGQHDLIHHQLDRWKDGGLGVIHKSKLINVLTGNGFEGFFRIGNIDVYSFPYSIPLKKTNLTNNRMVAFAHQMVIKSQKEKLWPDQKANSAKKILKQFPEFNLIVTGDNHQSFASKYDDRWLVNPGSIMRMSANQINFKPCIYTYYSETNEIKKVYLPIETKVHNLDHITKEKQRDEHIKAFVLKLKDSYSFGFNFEDNLKKYLNENENEIAQEVETKIWKAMKS